MKALYFSAHGTLSNLTLGELPQPVPAAGEVLVRVRACALNRLDLWVLAGWPGLKLELPHVGGSDIAGEVIECGPGVGNWKKGSRVLLSPGFVTSPDEFSAQGEESLSPNYKIFGEDIRGGLAEYLIAPQHTLHKIPDGFSFSQAASVALVGVTSMRMLRQRAQLQSGETVVIVGAGGGLNSFALQLAKCFGARVIALTSSAEKAERVKALGADFVINYKETPEWSKEVRRITEKRGAEVIVDNVGQATIQESLKAATRGGRIVTVGNTSGYNLQFDNRLIFGKQLSYLGSTMGSAKDFTDAIELVWSGEIKPVIDRELPLTEGVAAYQALERGEQFGKIVVLP